MNGKIPISLDIRLESIEDRLLALERQQRQDRRAENPLHPPWEPMVYAAPW